MNERTNQFHLTIKSGGFSFIESLMNYLQQLEINVQYLLINEMLPNFLLTDTGIQYFMGFQVFAQVIKVFTCHDYVANLK